MVALQAFSAKAHFGRIDGRDCILINGQFVKYIKPSTVENYGYLEYVFSKWLVYNYPSFWRNPIAYIFGNKKTYDWEKINGVK